jgi:hypothetical protein
VINDTSSGAARAALSITVCIAGAFMAGTIRALPDSERECHADGNHTRSAGEMTMRTTLCSLALLAIAATAHADVPRGPDSVHGAFARMLGHEPGALSPASADRDDAFVEYWVNSMARQELGNLEAGFVHMLERAHDAPRPLVARGEPDPLATMVASALRLQQAERRLLAGGPAQ